MKSYALALGAAGIAVIRNVRALRVGRGWSAAEVASRADAAGFVLPRNVIANLENGRRAMVTVDELAALAAVLAVEPWSLTSDEPVCTACRNNAPAGFACLTCGNGREATDG